jgi:Flp pilus assembly CpaE family ATPase
VDDIRFVASKVSDQEEVHRIEELVGAKHFASVPLDEAVARAEQDGVALLDAAPDAEAVAAIERLADRLEGRRLTAR